MIVKQLVAGNTLPSGKLIADIQFSVQKLILKFTFAAATYATRALAVTALMNARVTGYLTAKDSSQISLFTQVPLLTLMEKSQNGEGTLLLDGSAANGVTSVRGCIDLCPAGGLPMMDDQNFHLEIENLNTAATSLYTVYGQETPIRDFQVEKVQSLAVPQGQVEKTFTMNEVDTLALPVSAGVLKEIRLNYTNGVTVRFVEEELEQLAYDLNDYAAAGFFEAPGFLNHYVLGVENAVSINVTTNGSPYTFYAFGAAVADKPSTAAATNTKLADTTSAATIIAAQQVEAKS